MPLAFWCVCVAALHPYLWTAIAKVAGGRFDNRHPRVWQTQLQGWPLRAHAAHLNSFEAFSVFAAAVIMAFVMHAPQGRVDVFALAFVGLRTAYGLCYIANWHKTRSLVWFAAMGCVVAIVANAAL